MSNRAINIKYPFKNSKNGGFVELTITNREAIKSNLLHLLLTRRGERYFNPNFGTNLLRFLFEPKDEITLVNIKDELRESTSKYIPSINIIDLFVENIDSNDYRYKIRVDYEITNNNLSIDDTLTVNL